MKLANLLAGKWQFHKQSFCWQQMYVLELKITVKVPAIPTGVKAHCPQGYILIVFALCLSSVVIQ